MNKKIIYFFIIFNCFFGSKGIAAEKILFAIDLIRHGDRNPIQEIPKSPHYWEEGLGALTPKGKQQSMAMGAQLRQLYINTLHLLPEYYDPTLMYIRSTDKERTIATANALLLGLYPPKTRLANIRIDIVPENEDPYIVKKSIKDNKNISEKIDLLMQKKNRDEFKMIMKKFKRWSKSTGIPLHHLTDITPLADTLYIRQIYHVPLPKGISQQDAEKIIELANWVIINKFKHKSVTRPVGHALLQKVESFFTKSAQGKEKLKYAIFSSHDSVILSVMNTLGVPLESVPDYNANVNFILFKRNDNYFVKIRYNNKLLFIPSCKNDACSLGQIHKIARDS